MITTRSFLIAAVCIASLAVSSAAETEIRPLPREGGSASSNYTPHGDRHSAVNCIYLEAAFYHAGKGGRIIDVTKPPFNAKGDGVTDDTKALVAAMDFIAKSREMISQPPHRN